MGNKAMIVRLDRKTARCDHGRVKMPHRPYHPALWLPVLLLAACSFGPVPTVAVAPQAVTGPLPSPPPWPAPADPLPGLAAIGIKGYLQEKYDTHIHIHLSVYYEGKPVAVPGGLGIDPKGTFIAPMHTHIESGVVHLQGPTGTSYTLGQLFTLWGIPLQGATAYDRGVPAPDAAALVLQADHEIAVVFGAPPARIPVDYDKWVCVNAGLCE
jgi:hypothetical protein